ncbi:methyltransferase [Candidatus Woesearchaeota archaeon]|nr:methyltransferase [Candidatus Woesearchaeota archaeon]
MKPYEPAEDSYLLAEAVKKFATGRVLDMGTGSGIQAITAAKSRKVKSIVAADISQEALKYAAAEAAKEGVKGKITFSKSNLFSNVTGEFDTIIFNPPYLPQDKGIDDRAIYGGKKGHETIEMFLDNCSRHLKSNGIILLLFSSLSGKNRIERAIENKCLQKEELEQKKAGMFEELYTYKITKTKLLAELEKKRITGIRKFAKGRRGIVYTGKLEGMTVAIKSENPETTAKGKMRKEANWLRIMNKASIGAKLIGIGKNYFIYKFAEGDYLPDFIRKNSKEKIIPLLINVLKQCHTLDKMRITKQEMQRPKKHIIIAKGKPVMIDFERCKKMKKPKNVTQFCQYLTSGNTQEILKQKGITIERQKLLEAAKDYKTDFKGISLKKIIKLIQP